jgi:hypothetical protein
VRFETAVVLEARPVGVHVERRAILSEELRAEPVFGRQYVQD